MARPFKRLFCIHGAPSLVIIAPADALVPTCDMSSAASCWIQSAVCILPGFYGHKFSTAFIDRMTSSKMADKIMLNLATLRGPTSK